MFKINDLIRIGSETHVIVRTHHPVTELHPDPRPLSYAAAGCGRSVDGRDVIPWAPVPEGTPVTCRKGCAGTGPVVESLTPDAALDIPGTAPAAGWAAGRKGKGKRMHGIPDVSAWTTVPVTSGRGKNKTTRHVVQWAAACGDVVGGWDAEVTVPGGGASGDGNGTAPDMRGPDGTVTRYAPHATDAGPGGIQWCGNCAGVFKALRGTVAPKAVLTSKTPDNVGRYGERTDAQDRANARAAWLGRVLPLLVLTLGACGETVADGSLVVVGKGGPVHAGALDGHGRMMLVCRTGVLSRSEWKRPAEGREVITCPGCRDTVFDMSDPLSPVIRPLVMGAIMRGTSLPDAERFAPLDSGSGMTDVSSVTDTKIPVAVPDRSGWNARTTDNALRRMADADSSQKRFPFDRARGEFRTGARGKGDRSPYTPEERKERRTAERDDLTNGRARLWNTVEFTATHPAAPGGKRFVTMVISRNVAERLGSMVTGPDGDRITGWDYVYAMGALPASVKAVLTREERARLYGGGKAMAKRATAARKARAERSATARGIAVSNGNAFARRRIDDGSRADRFGNVVYGTGRDFSDRAASRVI